MNPCEISLDLREKLDPLIEAAGSVFSEYSFANLFLFRHVHDYRFFDGSLQYVSGVTYDGCRHAFPISPVGSDEAEYLLSCCEVLYPLEERDLAAHLALGRAIGWNDADSDYLYRGQDLATLSGAKARRSQARRFQQDCRPEVVRLTRNTLPLAKDVLEGWLSDVARPSDRTDAVICLEALDLVDELGLEGMLAITGEGAAAAFILAGPGGGGSRIIHFAKGRRRYAGAYPWLFAHYAQGCGNVLINLEQDLGNPGFAQSKKSLAPCEIRKKYRVGGLR